MSEPVMGHKAFNAQLKKYYSFYTGGFILFLLGLALAEQMGMSTHDVYLAKSRVAARLREIVQRLEAEYEEAPGEWDAAGVRPSDGLRG